VQYERVSLRPRVSFVLCVVLFLAACRPAVPPGNDAGTGERQSAHASAIVAMTNEERKRAGLPSLRQTPRLGHAAQLHAAQMAHIGRLDHELPGEPYPRPEDRLAAAGYEWQAWAENIAYGRESSDVVSGWMASPEHRANTLNPIYTEMGVGVAPDPAGRLYHVQVFGRPRP
jgi:uncharacterized protein YkwD